MKINVIDVESTCWDTKTDNISEIIQIGITQVNLTYPGLMSGTHSVFIKPTRSDKLSEFCKELTGLTDEDVFYYGIPFQEAIRELRVSHKIHRLPWASWGDYDRKKFVEDAELNNVPYPMSMQHLNLKLMYSTLTRSSRLGMDKALENLGLELIGRHHDGGDDAFNIARILLQMIARYET